MLPINCKRGWFRPQKYSVESSVMDINGAIPDHIREDYSVSELIDIYEERVAASDLEYNAAHKLLLDLFDENFPFCEEHLQEILESVF